MFICEIQFIICCLGNIMQSVSLFPSMSTTRCASRVTLYLGLDDKCPVSTDGDLLLHDTEAVEPADEQSSAV